MPTLQTRIKKRLSGEARRLRERYYTAFYNQPRTFEVPGPEIVGPYRLVMTLADGPGMRKRLKEGTEVQERALFLSLIKKGFACCDVGAHVGDYTVEMAKLAGPEGRVYAYEAIPHYYHQLEQTIGANGLKNCAVRLAAVGSGPGSITVDPEMLTGSLVLQGRTRSAGGSKTVEVIALDSEIERLDAIKIDCEGFEFRVLTGMERLLSENEDLVLFLEVHDRQLKAAGDSLEGLAELLYNQHGFKLHQISYKHCVGSRSGQLPLDDYRLIPGPEDFVAAFKGT